MSVEHACGDERRLVEAARDALSRKRCDGLREVRCEGTGRTLVLRGRVASYYLKQLAQEIARRVAYGSQVVNLVVVAKADDALSRRSMEPSLPNRPR